MIYLKCEHCSFEIPNPTEYSAICPTCKHSLDNSFQKIKKKYPDLSYDEFSKLYYRESSNSFKKGKIESKIESVKFAENMESSIVALQAVKISKRKFFILSVSTFGYYSLWWIYQLYSFFRDKEVENYNPAIRASLNIFYILPLINKILALARSCGYKGINTSVFVFLLIILQLFFAIVFSEISVFSLISVLLAITTPLIFFPIFSAWNYILDHYENVQVVELLQFKTIHKILIFFGICSWVLIIMYFVF